MRSQLVHASGQRPQVDPRAAQLSACSCSYSSQPVKCARHEARASHVAGWDHGLGRRPSSACGAVAASSWTLQDGARSSRQRGDNLRCFAAVDPGPGPESAISGYTPANYISFSEDEKDVAAHAFLIEVDAPASICFGIWNDWNRLVEFMDLVAQIGLDANNPDLALFQCFYRHGLLPVMEIVFVLQKTEVVQDKRIAFESVWGMPMAGAVSFKSLRSGKTRVKLAFSQSLPDLLVDLKVGVFGVQNSLMPILSENMHAFRRIAEAAARDPSSLPPREEAGERAYVLFDEEADQAMFMEIMENFDVDEDELGGEEEEGADEEGAYQQQQEDEEEEEVGSRGAAAGATGPSAASSGAAARGLRSRDEGGDSPRGSSGSVASASSSWQGAGAAAGDSRRAGSRTAAGRASSPVAASEADLQRLPTAAGKGAGRAASETAPSRGAEATAGSQGRAGTGGVKKRAARSRGAL